MTAQQGPDGGDTVGDVVDGGKDSGGTQGVVDVSESGWGDLYGQVGSDYVALKRIEDVTLTGRLKPFAIYSL